MNLLGEDLHARPAATYEERVLKLEAAPERPSLLNG